MSEFPLVSVICLCYNHSSWVEEAVLSVLNQTYPNIEIIVADDASQDGSPEKIRKLNETYPELKMLLFTENRGNCKTFNDALKQTSGDFVIDFSTDDVMISDRIEKQVNLFSKLDQSYGVVFTDATTIDGKGKILRHHYEYLFKEGLLKTIPEGDVYRYVLTTYFIASPTMMVKKAVFDKLGGYDEALAYEDFDFWVRSARYFKYAFLNERLTLIRRIPHSLSTGWYKKGDKQVHSTYLVCRKAVELSSSNEDIAALIHRIRYELKQAVFSNYRYEAGLFYSLLKESRAVKSADTFLFYLSRINFPLSWLRRLYLAIRYR